METGSDFGSEINSRRTAREPVNLTLDFEHAHVSGHSQRVPARANWLFLIAGSRSLKNALRNAFETVRDDTESEGWVSYVLPPSHPFPTNLPREQTAREV